MIISGGKTIYPPELAELLFQSESASEVAIVGIPDERLGETLVPFIRPSLEHSNDSDALFAHRREHLSP